MSRPRTADRTARAGRSSLGPGQGLAPEFQAGVGMSEREGGSCANPGSRHNSAQQLNGVNSHLCALSMNESARSSAPGTWAAGSGRRCPSRRMPRSPSSARTCSPTHDLFARHHDLPYYGLTAFACIRYFRHELFVNAQSFVFKLLFPLLLARFQEFDRGEAEGVGDMPIPRISAVRPHSVVPAGVVSQPTAFPTRDYAGRRG